MAASSFLDVCRFNPTLGGTTDWTYSSPVQGYNTPALANAITATQYSIRAESADLSQWEVSQGNCTITGGVATFARTTVLYNSSGTGTRQSGVGTKISFTTAPQVAVVALAEDLALLTGGIGQIPGDTTGALTPNAGTIGEEVHSSGATSGDYVTGTQQLVGTLNIPSAGDWDVCGTNDFGGSGSTSTSDWATIISTSSSPTVTTGAIYGNAMTHDRRPAALDCTLRQSIGPGKFTTTGPQTIYMYGAVTVVSGTVYTSQGFMRARRMR